MKRSESILGVLRIPIDGLAVLAALLLSFRLREENIDLIPNVQLLEPATTLPPMDVFIIDFVLPGLLLFLAIAGSLHLYAFRSRYTVLQEFGRLLVSTILWLVFVMAWYFLVRKQLFYSRILLLHSTFFIALFVSFGRMAVLMLRDALLRHGIGIQYVVSVGQEQMTPQAIDTLERDVHYVYLGHVQNLSALQEMHTQHALDLAIQTDPNPQSSDTLELIDFCRSQHIGYAFFPPVMADVPHLLQVEHLGLLPLMRFHPTPLDGWGRVLKRLFDIAASILLIVILSPLLCIVALAIVLESGFPILYVSRRIGEHGRSKISFLKFRSMVKDADALKKDLLQYNERTDGPLFKMTNDPRITRLGKLLRRFDIDELPQLFNVLVGQMSLVGPRAHLPEEVERYTDYQRRVFAVKPGITGLAQISGRSDLNFEEEVRLDLRYIEEWSLLLDLWILMRTAIVVVRRERES